MLMMALIMPMISQAFILDLPGQLPGEGDTFTITFGYRAQRDTTSRINDTYATSLKKLSISSERTKSPSGNPLKWIRVVRKGQSAYFDIPEGYSAEELAADGRMAFHIPVTFENDKLAVGPIVSSMFSGGIKIPKIKSESELKIKPEFEMFVPDKAAFDPSSPAG